MTWVNAFLAFFWLSFAGVITYAPQLLPADVQRLRHPLALLAVVMALYNMTRWWLLRAQARYLRESEAPLPRRRRRHDEDEADDPDSPV